MVLNIKNNYQKICTLSRFYIKLSSIENFLGFSYRTVFLFACGNIYGPPVDCYSRALFNRIWYLCLLFYIWAFFALKFLANIDSCYLLNSFTDWIFETRHLSYIDIFNLVSSSWMLVRFCPFLLHHCIHGIWRIEATMPKA